MKLKNTVFILCILFISSLSINAQSIEKKKAHIDSIVSLGYSIYISNPDKALQCFEEGIAFGEQLNDSYIIANSYNGKGLAYTAMSEYKKSFDAYFIALKYAPQSSKPLTEASVNNNIGILYANFKLTDLALKYFLKAEELMKDILEDDPSHSFNYTLINIGVSYREQEKHTLAIEYLSRGIKNLKVSKTLDEKTLKIRMAITSNELGYTYIKKGEIDKGVDILETQEALFNSINDTYLITLNAYYLAEGYLLNNQHQKALTKIKIAEKLIKEIKNKALKRDVYTVAAKTYEANGNITAALSHLKNVSSLEKEIFNSQQVWALYSKDKDLELIKRNSEVAATKNDERINNMLVFLYAAIAILAIITSLVYFKLIRDKNNKQREYSNQLQEITQSELKQTKEVLEIKKRELTTAALQIIESGESVQNFKNELEAIKSSLNTKDHDKIDKLANTISDNSRKNWESFRSRFEQVNADFFKNIREEYPTLTPSEMKLCSFLKLNFNSKDIANLLGISPESVKVSRYRLRKKMKLTRSQNLTEHINKF